MWMRCVFCTILYGTRSCVTLENNQAKVFFDVGWKTFFSFVRANGERGGRNDLSLYCKRPVLPASTSEWRADRCWARAPTASPRPRGVDICNYITSELRNIYYTATSDAGLDGIICHFLLFAPATKVYNTRRKKMMAGEPITINIVSLALYQHKQDHLEFVSIRVTAVVTRLGQSP